MNSDFILIGIDGGATKVSAWIIEYNSDDDTFVLSDDHAELNYNTIDGYNPAFKPVAIDVQLAEFQNKTPEPTPAELTQGETYVEACARVIISLAKTRPHKAVLAGLGMPGLKTEDRRGISVVANGPRIPFYADYLEKKLQTAGIALRAPLAHIGSDADYCGMGEAYAREGSFRGVANAYYLGGGTGAADALLLQGKLVPFDQTKAWLAKSWELKNDLDISLERYASASGLQHIYAMKSGRSTEQLNSEKIYPPQIAALALQGEESAIAAYRDAAKYLALLFYERIVTLYCGYKNIFTFVNPNRAELQSLHPFHGILLDRIVVGQRLGSLMNSRTGNQVLTQPLTVNLARLIAESEFLAEPAKKHYLHGNDLKSVRLMFSPLREAPALGAGIDAYLCNQN